MSPMQRYAKKQAKARQRRRLTAQERLERDRRQAQHAAKVVEQALHDLGLPENLVAEIEGRLRSQQKLLGKIVGVMCPPLFGCRTNAELCRVRGWDKNLPSRLLGALPKRSWLKRLRRLGVDVLVPLWRHTASASAATRSRWQWTWVGDDSVFKKYGEQLGLVGTWWSGQEHRVLSGIDGVLLVVVIGRWQTRGARGLCHSAARPHRPWGAVPRQTALAPGHAGWTHGGFPPTRCGTAPADGCGR